MTEDPHPLQAPIEGEQERSARANHLRTGLLLAGSALFGGIAVALWNRRTLARMRQELPQQASDPAAAEEGSTLD